MNVLKRKPRSGSGVVTSVLKVIESSGKCGISMVKIQRALPKVPFQDIQHAVIHLGPLHKEMIEEGPHDGLYLTYRVRKHYSNPLARKRATR